MQAIAERWEARLDEAQFLVHELPHRYVSSEETAAGPLAERRRGPAHGDPAAAVRARRGARAHAGRQRGDAGPHRPDRPVRAALVPRGRPSRRPGHHAGHGGRRGHPARRLRDRGGHPDRGRADAGRRDRRRRGAGRRVLRQLARPAPGQRAADDPGRAARRSGRRPAPGCCSRWPRATAGWPRRPGCWATWPARARSSAGRACSACPPSPTTSPSSRPGGPRATCCGGWTGGSGSSPAAAPAAIRTARSGWPPRR